MASRHTMDLTTGSVAKKLLIFALPILVSNQLQHLYSAADNIVVGQFAGKLALAAVGSTGSATVLILNLLNGLSVGANVVCANLRGAKKQKELSQCMHTAILLAALGGIFFSALGVTVARPLLKMMKSPDTVIDQATLYMRIYCLGIPASMLYNFGAGILRAHGDTRRPMIILTVSGVINVCLNLVFVILFRMSVAGVAIATVTSQLISAVSVLTILFSPKGEFKMRFRELRFHRQELCSLVTVGVPCGLNGLVFSVSNVTVQSTVNSFGDTAMAGSAAAGSINDFIYLVLSGFYTACVSFSGQCFGAHKFRRIDQLLLRSILMCAGVVSLMATAVTVFPRQVLSLYNKDAEVLTAAIPKLLIIAWSYIIYTLSELTLGCLRGMGKSGIPTLLNACFICVPRLLWIWFIVPLHPSMGLLYICYPVSYVFNSAALGIYYFYCRRKIREKFFQDAALEANA